MNELGLDLFELGTSWVRERGSRLLGQVDPLYFTGSIRIMRDLIVAMAAGHVELELPDDGIFIVIHH